MLSLSNLFLRVQVVKYKDGSWCLLNDSEWRAAFNHRSTARIHEISIHEMTSPRLQRRHGITGIQRKVEENTSNLLNSPVPSTPERRVPWGYVHSSGPVNLGGMKLSGRDEITPIVQIPYSQHCDFFLWNLVYFDSNWIETPHIQSTINQHCVNLIWMC